MNARKKISRMALSACIVALAVMGCQKTPSVEIGGNRLIPEYTDSKESSYVMYFLSGHGGSNCPGCMMIGGKTCHIDCQGPGDSCSVSSRVVFHQSGTYFTATTTDTFGLTNLDFYLMPDRSLNYTDDHNNRVFLNIPCQLVYRDVTTQQFTFTGLSITSTPVYSNN